MPISREFVGADMLHANHSVSPALQISLPTAAPAATHLAATRPLQRKRTWRQACVSKPYAPSLAFQMYVRVTNGLSPEDVEEQHDDGHHDHDRRPLWPQPSQTVSVHSLHIANACESP